MLNGVVSLLNQALALGVLWMATDKLDVGVPTV